MSKSKDTRSWGAVRIEVRGPKKWTAIRRGWYWGAGYAYTKLQAEELAATELTILQATNPAREYRIAAPQEAA